jgi:hypothetical protein
MILCICEQVNIYSRLMWYSVSYPGILLQERHSMLVYEGYYLYLKVKFHN